MSSLLDDLKSRIASRQVVVVAGTGVSLAATERNELAGWPGLLKSGVERCCELFPTRLDTGWKKKRLEECESLDLQDVVSVAGRISSELKSDRPGDFAAWLSDTIGKLEPKSKEVIEALGELGVPITTTNYDSLIESALGWEHRTWRDGGRMLEVLNGRDRKCVLHLHGYWTDPESIVLGTDSYERVVRDEVAQQIQQFIATGTSLLFVGCNVGLTDPNFSGLRTWLKRALKDAPHHHYRLALDGEVASLEKEHAGEGIKVLGYGASHKDLPAFLRSLRAPASRPAPTPAPTAVAPLPPKPAYCFGRKAIIKNIVATITTAEPEPIPILGPPGIGKSTVTLEALHDDAVATKYGSRRWFVRLEGASSPDAIWGEVARAMGLELSGDLRQRVLADLARTPSVLALDNFETPWLADKLAAEEVLAHLGGARHTALLVSVRGGERPGGIAWRSTVTVTPLETDDARRLFLAIAGTRFEHDEFLKSILTAMGGLPLALKLVAHVAQPETTLELVWKRWEEERTALLKRGDSKDADLEASFELSWRSPALTDKGRRLLGILSMLPAGAALGDLEALLPRENLPALSELHRTGLGYDAEQRVQMLPPLRECAARLHPPEATDRQRVEAHYLELAQLGRKAGAEGGAEAIARLVPDLANLESIVSGCLATDQRDAAIDAAVALAQITKFAGVGTARLLLSAAEVARKSGDALREALCTAHLGVIAQGRSQHDAARAKYEEALRIFRGAGSVLGEANCITSLGQIAHERSQHDEARAKCEEALPLYRRIGGVHGEASCIEILGNVAFRLSHHDEARAKNEEALTLYRRVGNVLGEANCIQRLGDIALQRSQHEEACAKYEEALPLYRRLGDLLGEANCIWSLGNVALRHSQPEEAFAKYEEALPLYRRIGAVQGEANCMQGLGDIAFGHSRQDEARAKFDEALALYERIPEPYSIGQAHRCLARVASASSECARHLDAARAAWKSVGRDDLIAELDAEFGPSKAVESA